jgi:phosphoribosylformylglycinamidine cyclo-ligase
VRHILEPGLRDGSIDLRAENAELNTTLGSALLSPTRIYVKTVLNLMSDFTVKGLAHITGGGFPGNVPRVLPKGVQARIDPTSWPRPPIFGWLQRQGKIDDEEMLRVFNCGVGMVMIVPAHQANDVLDRIIAVGERAYRIGEIVVRSPDDPPLRLGPLGN